LIGAGGENNETDRQRNLTDGTQLHDSLTTE
jgi:hypothetical protein